MWKLLTLCHIHSLEKKAREKLLIQLRFGYYLTERQPPAAALERQNRFSLSSSFFWQIHKEMLNKALRHGLEWDAKRVFFPYGEGIANLPFSCTSINLEGQQQQQQQQAFFPRERGPRNDRRRCD